MGPRGRREVLAAAFAVGGLFATSCALITRVGDLTETSCLSCDGGGAPDGGTGADGGPDTASPPDAATVLVVDIAAPGSVPAATGLAQQTHVFYADKGARWWLFYIDSNDATLLKTRSSPDFVTWSDGPTLTLPYAHGDEGRDFSVAYASLASADVVHVTQSFIDKGTDLYHFHARGVISGDQIAFDVPSLVSSDPGGNASGADPDGPVTIVGSDGFVDDFSGFQFNVRGDGGGIGNENAWRSASADTGGTWAESWGALQNLAIVGNYANSRAAVGQPAGNLLAVWENGSSEPDPGNLRFALWTGSWSSADNVGAMLDQDPNDWSVGQDALGVVTLVRRGLDGTLDARRLMAGSWSAGGPIATDPGLTGSGLVIESTGAGLTLYTLSADASNGVRATTMAGGTWAPWRTVVGTPAARSYLSGYSSTASKRAALVWTEQRGNTYEIVGTLTTP